LAFAVGAMPLPTFAQETVQVTWSFDSTSPLSIFAQNGTTPLAGADSSGNGTGFKVQLGYYTNAISANPFAGAWVPVLGQGTQNSLEPTASMGDNVSTVSGTDDRFSFTDTINTSQPSTDIGLPPAGTIMSIRYYNASTVAGATFFGAASNSAWVWESPDSPPPFPMSFNVDETGNVFQGGADTIETNIAVVPEPSFFALVGLGMIFSFRAKSRLRCIRSLKCG